MENNKKHKLEDYNIKWSSQSTKSSDSMPLGGYDTGCNVWVEDNTLYLYLSESGTFDENNTMLKLCRLSMKIDDGSLLTQNFSQELHLIDGYITIDAGPFEDRIHIKLWAAINKPEVHIDFISDIPHHLTLSMESWRYREREVSAAEIHQCRDFAMGYKGSVITWPDIVEAENGKLIFYHRNQNDRLVRDILIKQQQLEPIADKIPNPLKNLTMGGLISVSDMVFKGIFDGSYAGVDHKEYRFSHDNTTMENISITLHTNQCETVEAWKSELNQKANISTTRDESIQWWNQYFSKSYILIDHDNLHSPMFNIGRNYQLFRYMLGCNYYGSCPTKFNGGLFTFDEGRTPDFRMWSGGGFTSQNQRLVYWGMLKTGDFEGMKPQLDFWKNLLVSAKTRVKHFWNHDGAFFFEQGNNMGICTGAEYGWNRIPELDPALEDNAWVRLHFSSSLEFAQMILEYAQYSDEDITCYLDYIENVVDFYFHHYPLDEDGKLLIFPSSALETYKGEEPRSRDNIKYGVKNPTDAVAGLISVTQSLMEYYKFGNKYNKYKELYSQCPSIEKGTGHTGNQIIEPARDYNPVPFNCELPQLYSVFPFSPRGLSEDDLLIARNTYFEKYPNPDQYLGVSWHQNGIFAARLGLYEEALKYLHIKFDNADRRFPAFWGPGHDWSPDHNHGGSGMIQLQEMLMRCDGNKIILFGAWDKHCNITFRLFAPNKTIVECTLEDGVVTHLNVIPDSRKDDIILCI